MVESRAAAHLGRGRLNGHGRRPSTGGVALVRHRATQRKGAAAAHREHTNVTREAQTGGGGLTLFSLPPFPTLHTMYTVMYVAAVLDQVLRTLCPRL